MRKTLMIGAALAAALPMALAAHTQDRAAAVLAQVRTAVGIGDPGTLKTFTVEARAARNSQTQQFKSEIALDVVLPDKYLRTEHLLSPTASTSARGFNGETLITRSSAADGQPLVFGRTGSGGGGGGATSSFSVGGAQPSGGQPTPEQQAMVNKTMLRSHRVELSRYMLGWFGMAHPDINAVYAYAGEAQSPDGVADVIAVTAEGGFEVKLFVDRATHLPLMLTYAVTQRVMVDPSVSAAPPAPRTIEHRIFFSDWTDGAGMRFPRMMQRATDGTTVEEWTIAKFAVNPSIDPKKFAK